MEEIKAVENVDTIDLHDDLHTRVVVAEGSGKTAQQDGAKAKVVHNVRNSLLKNMPSHQAAHRTVAS